MRSPGRTSGAWKRCFTGKRSRQRISRLAALAALVLAVAAGVAAAVVLVELRMPARLMLAISAAESGEAAAEGGEIDEGALADLCVYVQRCSRLGAPDLPAQRVQALLARKAGRGQRGASLSRASLAREMHEMVLAENGGEWESGFHRRRLERIASALAEAAGDPPDSYRLTLLDTTQTNAVSTADGRVYVTRGLVATSTDDEIAMVLAHEMHHIREGHWYSWWAAESPQGGDGRGAGGSGGDFERDVVSEAARALAQRGVGALGGEATTSYAQEFEADARGVLLASMCGYDGRQMYSILTRLPSMPVTSHPTAADRIAQVSRILHAMDDPTWALSFDPVRVAVRSVEAAMRAAGVHRPGLSGAAPGLVDVARVCQDVMDRVDAFEEEMKGNRWLGARGLDADYGKVCGRALLIASSLSVVDVAVDTDLGHGGAGAAGVVCGRVWLIRREGVWVPAVAQTLPGMRLLAPEWLSFQDELRGAAKAEGHTDTSRAVLQATEMWRDTAVRDFAEHLSVYAQGRLESPAAGDSSGGQTLEAIGWARFLGGRGAQMCAWCVRHEIHSSTLATASFSSALSLDGLPIASNSARLTLVLEKGEWKVAQVNLD